MSNVHLGNCIVIEKSKNQFEWIMSRMEVMPRALGFKKECCQTKNCDLIALVLPSIDLTKNVLPLPTTKIISPIFEKVVEKPKPVKKVVEKVVETGMEKAMEKAVKRKRPERSQRLHVKFDKSKSVEPTSPSKVVDNLAL